MKKSQRLMWKVFQLLLGFCTLLLVVLWLFETVFLGRMYEGIRKQEITKAIALVEQNIDSPWLGQLTKTLADEQEILVTPVHEFIAPPRPVPGDRGIRREAITQTREFVTEDGRKVSLVFYAIISPVNATIATIKVQLYYVTGIMLLLSVILAFVIARTVSTPIEKLNESAKILATGNYEVSFAGEGYREIHELSDTLNHTARELSRVEELRRELMANISHDLRTPLALIYSHAEMMSDFPGEITGEHTGLIMDETQRLASLVNDILDVSRLETGTWELRKAEYNFTESIRETVERVAGLVGRDGYSFEFEHDEDVYVNADRSKITQAFYNLLINAVHYSTNDLRIIVRQTVSDDKVLLEVEDRGDGIDATNLPYIWDRYYKVDKTHKRALAGTGLGLSIVKKIVDLHGGTYGVESEPGKGSTFWFEIDSV